MVGKDKIILNCILYKSDVALLKRIADENKLSVCFLIRNIVNVYCNNFRCFVTSQEILYE